MHRIIFLLFLCAASLPLAAQKTPAADTSWLHVVYTTDGNEFTGKIQSESAEAIVLETAMLGVITIKRANISRIQLARSTHTSKGLPWFENRFAPRYFVGPSAYSLRKGEGVFENSELFLNQVSYGFTDNFSLGVGSAPFFILWDGPFPIWVTPKLSFPIRENKVNVALGGMYGRSYNEYYYDGFGSDNDDVDFSAVYSVVTLGSPDLNLTAGLGLHAKGGRWQQVPIVYLAGAARLSRRFALLGESYFFHDGYERVRMIGFGCRFMGRGVAFDLGVATMAYEDEGVYPIPYGTLHIPFGQPKD